MSIYYSFYIGYISKDGAFHAFGPYDSQNNLRPCLEKSSSFISDIIDDFRPLQIGYMDTYLQTHFVDNTCGCPGSRLHYLCACDLPSTDFIVEGYFPVNELREILSEDPSDREFCFSESYTESEYGILLSTAVKHDDTKEIERLKKFTYYCYPDYSSKEYDSFVIKQYLSYQGPFNKLHIEETVEDLDEIVILMEIC